MDGSEKQQVTSDLMVQVAIWRAIGTVVLIVTRDEVKVTSHLHQSPQSLPAGHRTRRPLVTFNVFNSCNVQPTYNVPLNVQRWC